MTLAAIRDGLAVRLETIPGLRVYARPADDFNLPAAVVGSLAVTYDDTYDGTMMVQADIVVFVERMAPGTSRAVNELDAYAAPTGSQSVFAAIDGDRTLGAAVANAKVVGTEDYPEELVVNAKSYSGVRFRVEIIT